MAKKKVSNAKKWYDLAIGLDNNVKQVELVNRVWADDLRSTRNDKINIGCIEISKLVGEDNSKMIRTIYIELIKSKYNCIKSVQKNKVSNNSFDVWNSAMYNVELYAKIAEKFGDDIIKVLKNPSESKEVKAYAILVLSELLDSYSSATYQNPKKDNKTIGMLALENGINDLNIKEAIETINELKKGNKIHDEDVSDKCDSVLEKSNLVNETMKLKDSKGKDIADYYFDYQKEIVEKEFEEEGRSKGLFNTAVKKEADKRTREGLKEAIETAEKVNDELDKSSSGKNNKSNEGKEGK